MPAASLSLPPPGRIRLISIIIVGALLLQFLAVLLRTGPWLYPFINYPMYATAHYEGDRIAYEHTVYAIFDDGTERAFKSDDLVSVAGLLHLLGEGHGHDVREIPTPWATRARRGPRRIPASAAG